MPNTAGLFTQVLSPFQRPDVARQVRELQAERHARGFRCWAQFVAMLFCQLAQARSLREISLFLAGRIGASVGDTGS